MTKIGVFDSGVGGKAVADKLQKLFPDDEIISVNDSKNVPYGTKPATQITRLVDAAIQPLLEAECDAIVIACNTATTNAIGQLRSTYPDTHFIGIEPMVKPAARMTKTSTIAVLATPSTLSSRRYAELKRRYAERITVIEPDCSSWATLVELGESQRIDIQATVTNLLRWEVDTIVLGCTHYHLLKDRIEHATGPNVRVLEPTDAIGARIRSLLGTNSVLPE